MAKEKFIRGKRDDAKHAGLYHNRRMEQQADDHLAEFWREFGNVQNPIGPFDPNTKEAPSKPKPQGGNSV